MTFSLTKFSLAISSTVLFCRACSAAMISKTLDFNGVPPP